MTKERFLELMDKITLGVASAFDAPPEEQMEALDLLANMRDRADEIVELLKQGTPNANSKHRGEVR